MELAYRPETLVEALTICADTPVIPYAGGTDLMVRNRPWAGTPAAFTKPLMLIGHLRELQQVATKPDWQIGAGVTLSQLLRTPGLPYFLHAALREMASPGIRNSGTIGGNIMNASPAADLLVPLLLLDGQAILTSRHLERTETLRAFVTGPGKTTIATGELLTGIVFSDTAFTHQVYRKVGTRNADALSKLSFAGSATVENGLIQDFRIAIGAVAPTVVRSRSIEKMLIGQPIEVLPEKMPLLLNAYQEEIQPIDDQRSTAVYRKETALNLIRSFCLSLLNKEVLP